MATQQGVIKKFMASLDRTSRRGEAALDEAVRACSTFNSFQDLRNSMIRDCNNAKNGNDFLKTYCGINLNNSDTGAITGSDAGGSTTKTASSVVPEDGSLVMFNSGDWFDNIEGQDGFIVQLGKRTGSLRENLNNVAERSFSSLSTQEKYLWRSLYTWWIRNGLDLIAESYGDNYSFDKSKSSATNKNRTIYVTFEDLGDNGTLAETWGGPVHNQKSNGNLVLCINMHYYGTASGKNGEVKNEAHLDRTITHELTHAVMRANIDYFDYLPALIKEGMAELTCGIDDDRKSDIQKLANNSSLLSRSLVLDEDSVTVSGVNNPSYAGGYMFLRYLARQAGDLTVENKTDSKVTTFRGNDVIRNSNSYSTLNSGTGNDFIRNWSDNVKIYGGTGNDSISNDDYYNGGNKVTIDGGTGNDYLVSWGNNVNIVGGTGNDTIKNGTDADNVGGSKVTINGGTGNDYILNWGGAASMIGGAGSDIIWGDAGNDTIKGDAGSDKLHGEAGNDKIYGGAGSDSLWGGKGNDSLWGNAGADRFIYESGDGKDIIYGFDNSDMLAITGNFSTSYNKSKREIYFKVGSTSKAITLKNFTATSFNVNGTRYRISGNKLR